ncbi:MAG TPA: class I SAM-dependent methyltransferase [Solirubrobacterales bacterium]|nr:class I SAM-dependent methyltransferase [Solirubrobacterales bacterium]
MTVNAATAIWHDVECGGYEADLPLWAELAERRAGAVLELGCGTGRVALHLARRGHDVVALDRDPDLIASLAERAADLPVQPVAADARQFELPRPVALALAPMQFLQLLPTASDRAACLRRVAAALEPGGLLAAAIVERLPQADDPLPPLPDVREVDGWVYSSLPVLAAPSGEQIVLRRLRQVISPTGALSEEDDEIQLQALSSQALEAEADQAGFAPLGRRWIPPTDAHVGSAVVLLERTR